jgi:hypothetical protein
MTEAEAKRHLGDMLRRFTPGSVLHLLADVLGNAENERLGGLDDVAAERVRNAEVALFVFGLGINAACPR